METNVITGTPVKTVSGIPSPRDLEAYRLRTQAGLTYRQIGEKLGITHPTAMRAVKSVGEYYAKQYAANQRGYVAQTVDMHTAVYREAMKGWHSSRKDSHAKTSTTVSGGGSGGTTTESKTIRGQSGDAAFLAQANAAIKGIRDVLGIDAPKRTESVSTTINVALEAKLIAALESNPGLAEQLAGLSAMVDDAPAIEVTASEPQGDSPQGT